MYGSYAPVQNMIFVSDEEAQRYILPPNSKVLLMSKDKPVFYVKTTDSLGQYTIDTYSFEKITPAQQTDPNVVTQADLAAFKEELIALLTPRTDNTSSQQTQQDA